MRHAAATPGYASFALLDMRTCRRRPLPVLICLWAMLRCFWWGNPKPPAPRRRAIALRSLPSGARIGPGGAETKQQHPRPMPDTPHWFYRFRKLRGWGCTGSYMVSSIANSANTSAPNACCNGRTSSKPCQGRPSSTAQSLLLVS